MAVSYSRLKVKFSPNVQIWTLSAHRLLNIQPMNVSVDCEGENRSLVNPICRWKAIDHGTKDCIPFLHCSLCLELCKQQLSAEVILRSWKAKGAKWYKRRGGGGEGGGRGGGLVLMSSLFFLSYSNSLIPTLTTA